jgi:hypothetical protein
LSGLGHGIVHALAELLLEHKNLKAHEAQHRRLKVWILSAYLVPCPNNFNGVSA